MTFGSKLTLRISLVCLLAVALAGASVVLGQGVQTGTLIGTVRTTDGVGLPGVTVTVTSPALQGDRTAITSANGDYNIPYLPPGEYRVQFSLAGMTSLEEQATALLGRPTRVDAMMRMAATAEAITVTAEAPSALETVTVGANLQKETVDRLPVPRTPVGIGSLAAGVTSDVRNPVAGQMSISGGMAYDNAFLINGVNVQDPIFGTTNNLFIEDSIEETQVLTAGISAEYGHFTGGVVNAITKSGGNQFDGSLRVNLSKPEWRVETPFERGFRGEGVTPAAPTVRRGDLGEIYEATIGGPILRDRLWFFLAGRDEQNTTPIQLPATGENLDRLIEVRRLEGKLTLTLFDNHTLQGSYIENPDLRTHEVQVGPLTADAIGLNSERVNQGWVVNYNGVLAQNLFAEARYSEKVFGFRGLGGTLTDIVNSPMRAGAVARHVPIIQSAGTFNAPYFDATDPEDRNNNLWFGSLSYFLSTPRFGSHDLKAGVEELTITRTGGNSQTATGYVFITPYVMSGGAPLIENERLVPRFIPFVPPTGGPFTTIQWWVPTRGAQQDTVTTSFFLNDRWDLNEHLTLQLGVRHEMVDAISTGDLVSIDTSATVPRLGLSFDPLANGKWKFDATYAEYSGRYNPAITAENSPVGNPAVLSGRYTGPEGQGRDFAPGFDLGNYLFYSASVPTANVFIEEGMSSPINQEWTVSAGMALARGGWLKATYVDRQLTHMIEDFVLIENGCTNVVFQGVNAGCQDNQLYRNSDVPEREYQAIQLQGRYNLTRNWNFEGNWTHQFRYHGNYEGEGGQAFGATALFDRPEIQSPREFPVGRLSQFQEDKVRLWTTYTLNLGRAGNLSGGLLYKYDTGEVFNFTSNTARTGIPQMIARNPGYRQTPAFTYFFGERGEGLYYDSTSLFDVSLSYAIPIGPVEPWVKVDVNNMLNDDTLIRHNIGVSPDAASPLDENGLRTGFARGTTFGRPVSAASYVIPREYLISAGIRF